MNLRFVLATALSLSLVGGVFAQPKAGEKPATAPKKEEKPKPPAYTTIEKAGPDYAIQGEYGEAEADKAKFGVQVIALGAGKFRAVVFPGGLPGAGFTGDPKTKIEVAGARDGDKVAFNEKGCSGTITDGSAVSFKLADGQGIELKKVVRQSATMGLAAPAGAVVLFDGSSLDKWQGGTIDDRKFLCTFGPEPRTKDKFGDMTLHLEFMTPFMPTAGGQGRGNSGVYLQSRYEIQVLDSFGLVGVDNECGGIYKNAAPKVNMCLPPLVWQTYDIEFTAAKFEGEKKVKNATLTVKHNGVIIHENQEIKDKTGGGDKEAATPGVLKLQNHGNPVFYRNVWVVEKK